jgi:hypothetical protein
VISPTSWLRQELLFLWPHQVVVLVVVMVVVLLLLVVLDAYGQ